MANQSEQPTPEQQSQQAQAQAQQAQAHTDPSGVDAGAFDAAHESTSPETPETLDSGIDPVQELQDRLLRTQAEFDNFRKRSRRELEDERRYASMPLLKDLMPVIDNIGRAIEAANKHSDANSLLEGFKMVSQQLSGVLKQHHCVEIEALNQQFDPHVHDAILHQPSADHAENSVIMVTQSGYQLHDRVVRPAQVIVAKNPA